MDSQIDGQLDRKIVGQKHRYIDRKTHDRQIDRKKLVRQIEKSERHMFERQLDRQKRQKDN